ncbi:hydroxyacid dehydrogenase [Candidatus Pacearchaeota archaeon]|nr:hydroxyacid dehydrogenase [Candidatus Pacearchaeota archaeon]|tara:strand:+ start:7892 stop:8902 length:1011 start_codon:yes stop_codon:yes gene_type:complete
MKIVFLETDKEKAEYVRNRLGDIGKHEIVFFSEELDKTGLGKIKDAEGIVLFVDSEIDRKVMRDLPELKYVATMSTGYDHIDIESAKEFGINVSNVPSYGENTVAEHTFGLILNLSRKIWKGIESVKKSDDFVLEGLQGFDLKGKTLGVIGAGHIGQHVIKIANGFQMEVIAFNKSRDEELAGKLGFKYVELDELLEKSDVITLHVPLTEETKHMINKNNIGKVRKGSILINTSRGEIIETGALRWALDEGILAGAGLDVLEEEEDFGEEAELFKKKEKVSDWRALIENHLLIDYDNVIVTPHMAFYTKEAEQRILDMTVENVKAFLGGKVKNKVV